MSEQQSIRDRGGITEPKSFLGSGSKNVGISGEQKSIVSTRPADITSLLRQNEISASFHDELSFHILKKHRTQRRGLIPLILGTKCPDAPDANK